MITYLIKTVRATPGRNAINALQQQRKRILGEIAPSATGVPAPSASGSRSAASPTSSMPVLRSGSGLGDPAASLPPCAEGSRPLIRQPSSGCGCPVPEQARIDASANLVVEPRQRFSLRTAPRIQLRSGVSLRPRDRATRTAHGPAPRACDCNRSYSRFQGQRSTCPRLAVLGLVRHGFVVSAFDCHRQQRIRYVRALVAVIREQAAAMPRACCMACSRRRKPPRER